MILKEMVRQQNILQFFRNEFTDKGYVYKDISVAWIDGQLQLLNNLINKENFNVLVALIQKTYFRSLKCIDKGAENLISIVDNPFEWKLGKIENNINEWLNQECLIFSTEKAQLVFSKNNLVQGQKFEFNKWQ